MYIYGADPSSVGWFKSYWYERKRFIQYSSLSDDLVEMERWARGNKTYINTQKTKALLVTVKCIRRRIHKDTGMLEVTNGYTAKIEQVARHKLLGLTIDEDLYEVHVDELCNKLFKRLGLLRHIGQYLKKNQRIIFFNARFKPLMMYTSSVWISCNKMLLERVLRIQKWAARVILHAPRTSRTVLTI